VDEVEDARAAEALGLHVGQAMVMIHTGVTRLGHQVCTDYLDVRARRFAGTASACRPPARVRAERLAGGARLSRRHAGGRETSRSPTASS